MNCRKRESVSASRFSRQRAGHTSCVSAAVPIGGLKKRRTAQASPLDTVDGAGLCLRLTTTGYAGLNFFQPARTSTIALYLGLLGRLMPAVKLEVTATQSSMGPGAFPPPASWGPKGGAA